MWGLAKQRAEWFVIDGVQPSQGICSARGPQASLQLLEVVPPFLFAYTPSLSIPLLHPLMSEDRGSVEAIVSPDFPLSIMSGAPTEEPLKTLI